MKQDIFNLLDAINKEGLDNSQWGLCEDVENTRLYFGTEEEESLQGQYVFVYRDMDEVFSFVSLCGVKPARTMKQVLRGFGENRDTVFKESYIDFYKV